MKVMMDRDTESLLTALFVENYLIAAMRFSGIGYELSVLLTLALHASNRVGSAALFTPILVNPNTPEVRCAVCICVQID